MKRLGAVVLFAGAVLLSTHILAPAEPPAAPASISATSLEAAAQAAPLAAQLNQQANRLRERLAKPPAYPSPRRDPFRFGAKLPPRTTPSAPAPDGGAPDAPIVPSAPALPQLIAITSTTVGGLVVRSAVLGLGTDVQVVKDGDTYATFSVAAVSTDSIDLIESATGETYRISLR